MSEEMQEFMIFTGPMLSAEELGALSRGEELPAQEELRITPAEEDEVEFVSPSVPGRTVRLTSTESVEENG